MRGGLETTRAEASNAEASHAEATNNYTEKTLHDFCCLQMSSLHLKMGFNILLKHILCPLRLVAPQKKVLNTQ